MKEGDVFVSRWNNLTCKNESVWVRMRAQKRSWNYGINWKEFTKEERREILLAYWISREWGLPTELIHLVIEKLDL